MFYTQTKHGLLTNQSARVVLSILWFTKFFQKLAGVINPRGMLGEHSKSL